MCTYGWSEDSIMVLSLLPAAVCKAAKKDQLSKVHEEGHRSLAVMCVPTITHVLAHYIELPEGMFALWTNVILSFLIVIFIAGVDVLPVAHAICLGHAKNDEKTMMRHDNFVNFMHSMNSLLLSMVCLKAYLRFIICTKVFQTDEEVIASEFLHRIVNGKSVNWQQLRNVLVCNAIFWCLFLLLIHHSTIVVLTTS